MHQDFLYIRFYKPYRVLSAFTTDDHHRTLSEFGFPKKIYPVGRLDYDSEGLLILTNDNRFKTVLLDPRNAHPRVYYAQVENIPDEHVLRRLREGVPIGHYRTKPCEAELPSEEPCFPPRTPPIRYRRHIPTAWLKLKLFEGKNRQVRKMTAAVGYPTLRLIRTEIAIWTLQDLEPGQWKWILPSEIRQWLGKQSAQFFNARLRNRH